MKKEIVKILKMIEKDVIKKELLNDNELKRLRSQEYYVISKELLEMYNNLLR